MPIGRTLSRRGIRPAPVGFVSAAALGLVYDFTSGALPSGVTFARSSAGTRFNNSNVLVTEPADTARFDFNPANGALRGLLVEPPRTNVVYPSANIADAAWVSAGAVAIGASGLIAPDGSPLAARLDITGNGSRYIIMSVAVTAGAQYALSAFARRPSTGATPVLRLTTNNAAAVNTGMSSQVTVPVAWGRIEGVGVASDSNTVAVKLGSQTAADALDASVSGNVELFGVQLELLTAGQRQAASSYVAATTAAATRAGDVVTLVGGTATWRFTFDDATTQDVALTATGGVVTVPTNLNRAWIKRAEKL